MADVEHVAASVAEEVPQEESEEVAAPTTATENEGPVEEEEL